MWNISTLILVFILPHLYFTHTTGHEFLTKQERNQLLQRTRHQQQQGMLENNNRKPLLDRMGEQGGGSSLPPQLAAILDKVQGEYKGKSRNIERYQSIGSNKSWLAGFGVWFDLNTMMMMEKRNTKNGSQLQLSGKFFVRGEDFSYGLLSHVMSCSRISLSWWETLFPTLIPSCSSFPA